MTIEALKELFDRDLNRLKKEIESYKVDENLWKIEKAINNSAGNLCLHLIGNIKNYIGNGLGKEEYVRQRDFEFSAKFVDRAVIYQELEETIKVVNQGLGEVREEDLNTNFPMKIWKEETNMAFTLIHLYAHLNYHLGQISYHRRLIDIE